MEAHEAADQIREAAEGEPATAAANERFRARAALAIAVMAMLLAITSLGGGNAAKEMTNSNIHASDTWAFYQAKNQRKAAMALAADALEVQLALQGSSISSAARTLVAERIKKYKSEMDRYENEPDPAHPDDPLVGEGKKQLKARAQHYEKLRDRAMQQDPNFDFAEALFQIAIVLASVSILALSPRILWVALALAVVAALLMVNGFFLVCPLPTH